MPPQTRDSAEPKCVLITGGAGFIGSATAYQLLSRGDRVVIVDEINNYYSVDQKHANLNWLLDTFGADKCAVYVTDMCDKQRMAAIFEKERPSHICHLAARAGVRPSIDDPFIYVHSNVEGTVNLLELSRLHDVANFVYASSSSVYGGSQAEVFSEKDVTVHPVSQYAATKMSCELLAHTYYHLYGLNCTGLRFFTVYGPRGRPDMAPFKFVQRISNGIPIDMYGDGSTERDYTYIDDIVQGVVLSIDRPLGYEVFNLGCETPVRLRDFISTIEQQLGTKAVINQMPMQPGDVPRTAADVSKARRLLGYQPTTSLSQGLAKFCKWYTSYTSAAPNPAACNVSLIAALEAAEAAEKVPQGEAFELERRELQAERRALAAERAALEKEKAAFEAARVGLAAASLA